MKNHWLQIHNQKKQRYWTVEFLKGSLCVFGPRKIDVVDPTSLTTQSSQTSIVFNGAMTNLNDNELFDFIKESKKGMSGLCCYLRYYQGLMHEVEYYFLSDLGYGGANSFFRHSDLEFIVCYNRLRKVKH